MPFSSSAHDQHCTLLLFLRLLRSPLSQLAARGPSPNERFAEDVCAASLPRAREMIALYNEVRLTRAAPGWDSRLELATLIGRGEGIARKHVADISRSRCALLTPAGRP